MVIIESSWLYNENKLRKNSLRDSIQYCSYSDYKMSSLNAEFRYHDALSYKKSSGCMPLHQKILQGAH